MGLWQKVKTHFIQNRDTTTNEVAPGRWFQRSYANVPVTQDTALTLSTFWACVRAIANPISHMSCHVRQQLPNGGSKILTTHPADWVLSRQANPETTSFTFRETLTAQALTWGNGYAEIEQDGAGRLGWLWQITPDRVQPARVKETGELVYDVINRGAPNVVLPASRMFHLHGLGFDGVIGYSVVDYARQSIALGLATEKFGAEFFGNGLHPGGVAELPGRLSPEGILRLQASLHEQLKNSHDVLVLEEGLKWNQTTIPPENAQFLQTREFQVPEMCRWFGVPPHKIYDLTRATFCLPGDAQVFTQYGPKNIADIEIGEKVWSQNEQGQWGLSAVEQSGCTGEDEILTIKCRNRTLRCNAKHRVGIRREVFIPFEGGRGQCIYIDGKLYRKAWENTWIPAGDLEPGDLLLGVADLPEQGGISCPTRAHVSIEFMEVLGLLIGDGFYARNAKTGVGSSFGISHGEHDSYLPHYVAAIEKEFRAFAGPYGRSSTRDSVPLRAVRRDKNTTVFYSGLAYDELAECGIVGTAKTKRVPRWIFALTRELKLAFLRGYLDADGTVTKNGQIQYVSVNRELLDDVRHLCVSAGIPVANIGFSDIESSFDGERLYRHRLFRLRCCDAESNLEIGSHTDWYIERIEQRLQMLRNRVVTVYPYEQKRNDYGAGLLPTRIQSIERSTEKEPVYDLTVADSHTFVADLLLVHNSNIESQAIEYVTDSLVPWVERWEQEADAKLFGSNRSKLYAKFNVAALLRGDIKTRFDAYGTGRQWGWLSVNDVRAFEDMNPLPSHVGDTYLTPFNMQALSLDPSKNPNPALPRPGQPGQPQLPQDPVGPDEGNTPAGDQRLIVQAMLKLLERDLQPTAPAQITVNPSPISLHLDIGAPQFSMAPGDSYHDVHVQVPDRQVHVEVQGATLHFPDQSVRVDNHIETPERQVNVQVEGSHFDLSDHSSTQTDHHISVPERQVNVQVEGAHIEAPDHSIVHVENRLDIPEREVRVQVDAPQITLPDQSVHVDNRFEVPERPVQVHLGAQHVHVPERETTIHTTIENRTEVPERQVSVTVESPSVTVHERPVQNTVNVDIPDRAVMITNTVEAAAPSPPAQIHNETYVNVPERSIVVNNQNEQQVPDQPININVEAPQIIIPERETTVNVQAPQVQLPEQPVNINIEAPHVTVPEREIAVNVEATAPEQLKPVKTRDKIIRGKDKEIMRVEREVLESKKFPADQMLSYKETMIRDADGELSEIIREVIEDKPQPQRQAYKQTTVRNEKSELVEIRREVIDPSMGKKN